MNGSLFFDKRDSSQFDYLTVSETAYEPPAASEDTESINTAEKLSLEASAINQNFTQQILRDPSDGKRQEMDLPNPFYDEEESPGMEPASVAYRYRKFVFAGIELVRCWGCVHTAPCTPLTRSSLSAHPPPPPPRAM